MTEPLTPPPAAPPPRVRWLRVVAFGCLVSLVGFVSVAVAQGTAYARYLPLLLVLTTSPLLVLAWSSDRVQQQASEVAWAAFRKHWTLVWLGAVVATLVTCVLLRDWRGELTGVTRLATLVLLGWTSLLMLACWQLYRVLLNRKLWARAAFGVACITTLIALAYGYENWTGGKAWEVARREFEARGETFDFRKFHPAPVSDPENVGSHPLFAFPFSEAGRGRKQREDFTPEESALADHLHQLSIPLNRVGGSEWSKASASLPSGTNNLRFHDLAKWRHFFHDNTNYLNRPAPQDGWQRQTRRLAQYPLAQASTNPAVDVKLALTKLDASFAVVEEALRRPQCRFAVAWNQDDAATILLPHLAFVRNVARAYSLRASAQLALGETENAFRDLQTSLRVANLISNETFLICLTVRRFAADNALGCAAEGMARHQWSEAQLVWLSDFARGCDYLADYATSQRTEAAMWAQYWSWARQHREQADDMLGQEYSSSKWIRWMPSGWFYRHQLAVVKEALDVRLSEVDTARRRYVRPPVRAEADAKLTREKVVRSLFTPRVEFPEPREWRLGWARGQVAIDQFVIACALERHWLRHRAYPERLDALVPEFLDRLSHDLFDGQPMRYRREGEQGFVLWSIGFDGKDDNAGPLLTKPSGTTHTGEETGDLVWRYPQ